MWGATIHAHIRRRGYRNRIRLGTAAGPCGAHTAHKRLVRASAPSCRYRVQFDTIHRFFRKTADRIVFKATVFRRISR